MPKIKDEHTDIIWSRVDSVVSLILENERYLQSKRNAELVNVVAAKFTISIRQAQRYVLEAKKEIRRIGNQDKTTAFARAIRDREYLYKKAITPSFIYNKDCFDSEGKLLLVADLKLALDVAKDRDKLFGLYEEKIEIKGEVKTTIDFSGLKTEDLLELVNGLKKLNTTEN